jgi:hypothetical protein
MFVARTGWGNNKWQCSPMNFGLDCNQAWTMLNGIKKKKTDAEQKKELAPFMKRKLL